MESTVLYNGYYSATERVKYSYVINLKESWNNSAYWTKPDTKHNMSYNSIHVKH
jgi:hypothetical protein